MTVETRKIVIGVGLPTAYLAAAALYLLFELWRALAQPLPLREPHTLVVKPGDSLAAVAHRLQRERRLRQASALIFYARLRNVGGAIHIGEYRLEPGLTPLRLLEQLLEGAVIQYSLTLVEGWTFRRIMRAVREQPRIRQTLSTAEPAAVMAALGRPGQIAEGRFYPDTYHFPAGTTDIDFLSRAHARLQAILLEEWKTRAVGLPYTSPDEALIMASIIEKETAVASERARIAGVFVRRLQKGMRLQTDPTVIYALGENFDGNIRRRDLNLDSPYNTYRYAGLPPTPIAAVGREAIRAALRPAAGEELYFVSKGDGSHKFSATLQEHNAAVRKYQFRRR